MAAREKYLCSLLHLLTGIPYCPVSTTKRHSNSGTLWAQHPNSTSGDLGFSAGCRQ